SAVRKMPCACRSTVPCLRFSCCMPTGGTHVPPAAFMSLLLSLRTACSNGQRRCSKRLSDDVTRRSCGSPWEAFSYEQFSPDTSDAERGNDHTEGELAELTYIRRAP